MSSSIISPATGKSFKILGLFPAIMLLLGTSLLVALEAPSKPFLEKNSFYLSSAGFRVKLANDPAGQKAMHALPAHRFVIHRDGGSDHYLYAEPVHCVCIFVGTAANYQSYRDILGQGLQRADDIAPDYKNQASTLLDGRPYDWTSFNQPPAITDVLRAYY